MTRSLTVYGIPSCQTVRRARAWLADRGLRYTWVDLREDPPDAARVAAWVEALGARRLRNTSGRAYRALGSEREAWDAAAWVKAFAAEVMLMKRPVVEIDGEAALVGFRADVWEQRLGGVAVALPMERTTYIIASELYHRRPPPADLPALHALSARVLEEHGDRPALVDRLVTPHRSDAEQVFWQQCMADAVGLFHRLVA